MIFTTNSYKMLSLLPPSSSYHPQCKSAKRMNLTLWRRLVVLMMVMLVIIVHVEAGVIQKREIPFTIETSTEATMESLLTITSKYDPDIAQSDLSQMSTTPVTLSITSTSMPIVLDETAITEPVTKLVLHNNEMKSNNLPMENLSSSREYVHNEIVLNETKKAIRNVENQQETKINLSNTVNVTQNSDHVVVLKNSNENVKIFTESTNSHVKLGNNVGNHIETRNVNHEKETEIDLKNTLNVKLNSDHDVAFKNSNGHVETFTESTNSHAKLANDVGNHIETRNVDHEKETEIDVNKTVNVTQNSDHVESFTENTNSHLKLTKDLGNHIETVANDSVKHYNPIEKHDYAQMATPIKIITTETMATLEDPAKITTTMSTTKDNSIETYHIVQSTKQPEVTTEIVVALRQDLQHSVSKENVQIQESLRPNLQHSVSKEIEQNQESLSPNLQHSVSKENVQIQESLSPNLQHSVSKENVQIQESLRPDLKHSMSKEIEQNQESLGPDLQHSVSKENVQIQESTKVTANSQDFAEREEQKRFPVVTTTTTGPLRIPDILDRESLKEISNDLPEKTTESSAHHPETVLDSNKFVYARSMFKTGDEDITATTLRPLGEKEIESTTSLPNAHLDHLKNSIDIEEFTVQPLNEKKGKFINDNSTNAQKLNLPNNADVWSLVGMKPLIDSPNVTIETAPKHKELLAKRQQEEAETEGSVLRRQSTESSINNNSEKFLLDWSQIMMNKDLATTVNYQEINENFKNLAHLNVFSKGDNEDEDDLKEVVKNLTSSVPLRIESEGLTNVEKLLNNNNSNFDEPSTNTANSATTILSVSSFDNNNENNNRLEMLRSTSATPTPASVIINSITEMLDTTTEIIPTTMETATTVLKTKANPDLNEINLTLNKETTTTTTTDVGESLQQRDEHYAVNNRAGDVKDNANVHNDFTSEPPLTGTMVVDEGMTNRMNNNITTTTTTSTESTTSTDDFTTATTTTTTTTPMLITTSTVNSTSSEPTITFSTHETGKVNASNTSSGERNTIFDDSEKRQRIKSDNNIHASLKLGDKENIEIEYATTATTTDIPITTYKPNVVNFDLNSSGGEVKSLTISSPNNISIAEVNDQNGNEIEHKKSINVEITTPTSTTTTTTQPISGSFNISSTTIKTHLNEQVFEIATTKSNTTTSPYNIHTSESTSSETSEKTTSSSAKDVIINGKDYQLKEENNIITTPKLTTTTYSPEQVEENTTIGSSSTLARPLEQNSQDRELEVTTLTTDTSETPVVAHTTTTTQGVSSDSSSKQTTTLPTTTITTTTTSNEEDKDKDTTKVDTYFKFPLHTKGSKKEQQQNEVTVEPNKNDQLETTTMSIKSTINNTENEPIHISLLNETDSTTTALPEISTDTITITSTQLLSTTDAKIYTTATAATQQTTTSTQSPPPFTTTTIVTTDTNLISTKIDEVYKVVVISSTTTESPQFTTQHNTNKITENVNESPPIYTSDTSTTTTTTTPSSNKINEEFYSTLSNNINEEFTTMLPTKIITADIGGANSQPPVMGGGNSGNMFPKNSEASGETDVNVIIAITVSVIGVIALILLVAFLYLMRKRQKQTSYSQRCRPVSLDEYAIDNASVGGSMRKGSALRSSKRTYGNLAFDDPSLRHNPLGVHELAKFSLEKLRIFEEFRDVPQITAREDEVPQGCEDKNRYANVLPLPESRVVLQRLNDDYKTEYINANYVTGPKDTPNYYIACQAPLDSTVEDFWRMIWEQQSRVIIQATDLIENGVEKCAEYLPPSVTLDNHSTFGDFQITLQNREVKDKYAISTILLKHNGENVTRELTHYWYKWPETGVPAEEAPIIAMLLEARSSLISYAIEQANEDKEKNSNATLKSAEEGTVSIALNGASSPKGGNDGAKGVGGGNGEINGNISLVPIKKTARNQGPLTIHCSPGTGRTGTIIGCDIAIRSLETPKRTVDIPHIVYYVRRGRASAVLTKEQYEFMYKVANIYAAKISNPTTYN